MLEIVIERLDIRHALELHSDHDLQFLARQLGPLRSSRCRLRVKQLTTILSCA